MSLELLLRLGAAGFLVSSMGLFLYFWWISSPPYRGEAGPHFDGLRFHNLWPTPRALRLDGIACVLQVVFTDWIDEPLPGPGKVVRERLEEGELAVTHVNHATVLIQLGPLNILTDPVWDEYCSPLPVDFCRRRRRPGLELDELPPIDVVLVSHNHFDHLSIPTLRRLHARHAPEIYVGLGDKALLESKGITGVREMDWWEELPLADDRRLTYVPALHCSGRGLADRDTSLWGGFVMEGREGAVYFAGDTGFAPHFEELRRRFGPMRLALLPIGAFQPRWYMKSMHMDPSEAVEAHRILGARTSMAIHYGTFPLATDKQDEPLVELDRALGAAEVGPDDFWVLEHGEWREVP